MFIMPGIETAAPERTETSSGLVLSPNFLPSLLFQHGDVGCDFVHASRPAACGRSCSTGRSTSVVIVKPGGTGRPMLVMSARLAPLPPSSCFCFPPPSVLVRPK